ncbi:type II secretion system major pseudopilin GspG [Candidatus Nitrotoga sp. M5]|uniref:type II secretion system major pseudopilin GspG n=1 Tax=Candidatus Nitrotoga sp. M5 TaxID=2890409 RepID=UPI001EF37FB7|nr:type II secretion system major pseudopilin GspG [Candidatus Nitrotoga sp. M5]CAH1386513.1 Type II secretion system core protein G [Candidatus Nitrotoga sp. M5]
MKKKHQVRRETGFTLLELLVVLVILGLLAGLVGPKVMDYLGTSKSKTGQLQIEQLSQSLELFRLEVGRYPNSQESLSALIEAPPGVTGWNGPYIKSKTVPKDPWGNDYHYASPGQHNTDYDISSLGLDNREGGEGENKDINNWGE